MFWSVFILFSKPKVVPYFIFNIKFMLYGVIYVTWFDYIGTWYSPLYVILMYSKIHNSKTRFAPVKYLKSAVPMGEESNFRIRQPRFQCQLYH